MNWASTTDWMPPALLCLALGRPAKLPSGPDEVGDPFILVVLGSMLREMRSLAFQFEVFGGVVQLVAILMVNSHAFWNWPIKRFPNMVGIENPSIRFGYLDKRSLLGASFVARAYPNCPDWKNGIATVAKCVSHEVAS